MANSGVIGAKKSRTRSDFHTQILPPPRSGPENAISVTDVLRLIVDFVMMLGQFTYAFLEGIYLAVKGTEPVSVKDEIILITGSGHGIGRELSLQYAALGGNIVCVDINAETNDKTVKEIKEQGGKAQGYV